MVSKTKMMRSTEHRLITGLGMCPDLDEVMDEALDVDHLHLGLRLESETSPLAKLITDLHGEDMDDARFLQLGHLLHGWLRTEDGASGMVELSQDEPDVHWTELAFQSSDLAGYMDALIVMPDDLFVAQYDPYLAAHSADTEIAPSEFDMYCLRRKLEASGECKELLHYLEKLPVHYNDFVTEFTEIARSQPKAALQSLLDAGATFEHPVNFSLNISLAIVEMQAYTSDTMGSLAGALLNRKEMDFVKCMLSMGLDIDKPAYSLGNSNQITLREMFEMGRNDFMNASGFDLPAAFDAMSNARLAKDIIGEIKQSSAAKPQ